MLMLSLPLIKFSNFLFEKLILIIEVFILFFKYLLQLFITSFTLSHIHWTHTGCWGYAALPIDWIFTFYISHTRLLTLFRWTWKYLLCCKLTISTKLILNEGCLLLRYKGRLRRLVFAKIKFIAWLVFFCYRFHMFFTVFKFVLQQLSSKNMSKKHKLLSSSIHL